MTFDPSTASAAANGKKPPRVFDLTGDPIRTCPWAREIRVKRQDGLLRIEAWASRRESFSTREPFGWEATQGWLRAKSLKTQELRDLLTEYEQFTQLSQEKGEQSGIWAPHMQFANATSDDQLEAFVEEYGPVAADWVEDNSGYVRATQKLSTLRREQRIFASTVRLLRVLNDAKETSLDELKRWMNRLKATTGRENTSVNKRIDRLVESLRPAFKPVREALAQLTKLKYKKILKSDRHIHGWIESIIDTSFYDRALDLGDFEGLLWMGHLTLCSIFNAFPPALYRDYDGGTPEEVPKVHLRGVRPLLYFMLRQDYLLGRRIAICKRGACGKTFLVERKPGDYCSAKCSKRQRDLEYWEKTGRDRRREQRAGAKHQ